jgi:ABC-type glycerol-3-phosphate transport system permease component
MSATAILPRVPGIGASAALGNALRRAPAYLILGLWSVMTIGALVWVFLGALKTKREVLLSGWSLPAAPQWGNFPRVLSEGNLGQYFFNSTLTVTLSTLAILAVSVPAAYVLSRAEFRGREALTNLFVIGIGIPIPLLFIPVFMILAWLRLADSLTGLSIVFVAVSLPFTIYLLTGFFASLPRALEDAAAMDGCSNVQVFWHAMLPLARPGILTAFIINFIWLWNEYQLSLTIINSAARRPLSLGLYALQNALQYTSDWPGLFAGVTIAIIPTLLLYAILAEKMIAGLTAGAVK